MDHSEGGARAYKTDLMSESRGRNPGDGLAKAEIFFVRFHTTEGLKVKDLKFEDQLFGLRLMGGRSVRACLDPPVG